MSKCSNLSMEHVEPNVTHHFNLMRPLMKNGGVTSLSNVAYGGAT